MSEPVKPLTPGQLAAQEQTASKESYPHRVLVGADIFVDEIADGPMDETISTRSAIGAVHGNWFGKAMSRFLNLFQKNHGPKAGAGDKERAQSEEQRLDNSGLFKKE